MCHSFLISVPIKQCINVSELDLDGIASTIPFQAVDSKCNSLFKFLSSVERFIKMPQFGEMVFVIVVSVHGSK